MTSPTPLSPNCRSRAMSISAVSEEFVRTGDKISLYCEDCSGYLAADGITSSSLVVERLEKDNVDRQNLSHVPNHFERCVFTLNRIDMWDSQGLGVVNGEPLYFGQIITLKHDYTDTVLCIDKRSQSPLSGGSNRIFLERKVPQHRTNYFKILPKYKVRSEGDKVRVSDHVKLMPEGDDRHLNVIEEDDEGTDDMCWRYAVNISGALTETGWTIHVYDSLLENEDETEIRAGIPIALFHKEREGFAIAALSDESCESPVYLQIPNKANQRTYNIENLKVNVNGVWMIEHYDTTTGGPVHLTQMRQMQYRVKHLASHRYLAVVKTAEHGVTNYDTTLMSHDSFLRYQEETDGSDGSTFESTSSTGSEAEVVSDLGNCFLSRTDDRQSELAMELEELTADPTNISVTAPGSPAKIHKEISFAIPEEVTFAKKKKTRKPLDQMKGRAVPHPATLFYIHPLDEGHSKLQSATTFIRLQHVETGKWVQVSGALLDAVSKKTDKAAFTMQQMLKKQPSMGQTKMRQYNMIAKANSSDVHMGGGGAGDSDCDIFKTTVTTRQLQVIPTEKRAHDDVWCVSRVPQDKLLGLNTVIECRSKLQQYIHAFGANENFLLAGQSGGRLIANTKTKLEQLITACTQSEEQRPMKRDGIPVPNFQELLFSQDIHKVIIKMLEVKNQGKDHTVGQLCYRLLRAMVKGSAEHAAYLKRYLELFRRHLNNPVLGVCDLLLELYRDNRPFLDDVDEGFINDIFTYIKHHGLCSSPMELLAVLCTYHDQGITRSQTCILGHLSENPRFIMDTLVNAKGEVWVKIPEESITKGQKYTVRRGKQGAFQYNVWMELQNLCSRHLEEGVGSLLSYYKAMLRVFANVCKSNTDSIRYVRRWIPAEVAVALVGSESPYWLSDRKKTGILDDLQAICIDIALNAHMMPLYPTNIRNPNRLVIAWHNIGKAVCEEEVDDLLVPTLKRAALKYLKAHDKQIYRRPAQNRLISSFLTFWNFAISRKIFKSGELVELLPIVTNLLEGATDIFETNDEERLLMHKRNSQRSLHSYESDFGRIGRREYNEYSCIVMQSKILAIEVFSLRLRHESIEALEGIISKFKEKITEVVDHDTFVRRSSIASQQSLSSEFLEFFRDFVGDCQNRPHLRQQNTQLLPICLDLASYKNKELCYAALTFVFKSLWFGAELALNLRHTQILFSDESWVLFNDLTAKKQQLDIILTNMQLTNDESDEERCRALLGELVSLLQPKKQLDDECVRKPSRTRMRRGSVTTRHKPQVNDAAVLGERQDICRNLEFHALLIDKVLNLRLTDEMAGTRTGRWEVFRLCYHFLRLLCYDHPSNQEVVAPVLAHKILEHLDKNVGADETAVAVYKNNYGLAKEVPPELIKELVRELVEAVVRREMVTTSMPDVLNVLLVSETEDDDGKKRRVPVSRNQSLCMTQILSHVGNIRIAENLRSYVETESETKASVVDKRMDSGATGSRSVANKKNVLGNCKLLEILSLCCEGRNTSTEMGGQAVMPLELLLELLFKTVSAQLKHPPSADSEDENGDLVEMHLNPFEPQRVPWKPPSYLTSVLMDFLHNVYLHEGDDDDIHGLGGKMENMESLSMLWAANSQWWRLFRCFIQAVKEWREGAVMPSKRYSSGSLRKTPPGDDTGNLRKLLFENILPCVGTFFSFKFEVEVVLEDEQAGRYMPLLMDFLTEVVATCNNEVAMQMLHSKEVGAVSAFFTRMKAAMYPSGLSLDRALEVNTLYPETQVLDECKEKLQTPDVSSSVQMGRARAREEHIVDCFYKVQDVLIDTFHEEVNALLLLLVELRREMDKLSGIESWESGKAGPPWLRAIVNHLEDPSLPEQAITGLLKVFTKLIKTADLPLKKLEEAVKKDDFTLIESADDDDGDFTVTPHHINMQNKLNMLGLTSCMVKLTEIDHGGIAHEAICFGVALLQGGNKQVQDSMLDFFLNNDESFFESMKDSIGVAVDQLVERSRKWDLFGDSGEFRSVAFTPSLGSIAKVLRLLQLVCEGHHLRLQNYIRLQDDNLRSTNVVREVLIFLRTLMNTDGLITEGSTHAAFEEDDKEELLELAQQTFDTLTEFCQGPCPDNQNEIVGCNICGLVDHLLQAAGWQLLELKSKAITTLLSVLEGSGSGTGKEASKPSSAVGIMLKTLKLETIEGILTDIWGLLKKRDDSAGVVFREMDQGQQPVKQRGTGATGAAAAVVMMEPASHYVYEDAWMEQACEVLGVVEHVEAARMQKKDSSASLCDLLDVSFNLYILLLTLSGWSKEVTQLIDQLPGSTYFKRMVGTIEIARGKTLEKVYFRIPSTCSGLSRQTRHKVLWDLRDKDSRAAKLGAFFEVSGELIAEMKYLHHIRSEVQRIHITMPKHQGWLNDAQNLVRYKAGQFFTSPGTQDFLRYQNVRASLIVNGILLLTFSMFEFQEDVGNIIMKRHAKATERLGHGLVFLMPGLSEPMEGLWDDFLAGVVAFFCGMHLLLSVADLHLWWVLRMKRLLKEVQARDKEAGDRLTWVTLATVWQMVPKETSWGLGWRAVLVVVSGAAVVYSPFFSALHLLAIIPQSSHLRNVVSAVSLNGQTLLMTFAFGVLIVYLFSIVGYALFASDFVTDNGGEDLSDPNCVTLLQCFTFTLMNGMRSGGGVGDIISRTPLRDGVHHTQRMVFDYLFFIGVIVILLSIVSGIITDSFTELRKTKDDFEEEIRNFCFICGIESSTFERHLKGGFKMHTTQEHNMWNYLYFHHHLLTKKEDEFTGQESYVWERIQEVDFSFYPINKSMSMMDLGVLEDDGKENKAVNELTQKVVSLEKDIAAVTGRVNELAEKDFANMTGHIGQLAKTIESLEEVIKGKDEEPKSLSMRNPFGSARSPPAGALGMTSLSQTLAIPGRRASRAF